MGENSNHRPLHLPEFAWPETREYLPQIESAVTLVGSTRQMRLTNARITAADFKLTIRLRPKMQPNIVVSRHQEQTDLEFGATGIGI